MLQKTFFTKIKKIYSTCLVSVVVLAYLVSFGGVGGLSIDAVKSRHCSFKRPGARGRFLAEIQICCSIFPFNAKKDSPLAPFSGRLGKIFKFSVLIWTIFASLGELLTYRLSLWPSARLQHSLKSTLATTPSWQMQLTRWVHIQKFPLKYNPLPRLYTCLVSCICHAGPVANVDFKLCSSLADSHKLHGKVESFTVKQKSLELEWKV